MDILAERLQVSNVPAMVVTMGGQGAVYAEADGEKGICPAKKVQVKDTTGCGRCVLRGRLCRPDLWQDTGTGGGDRHEIGVLCHHVF